MKCETSNWKKELKLLIVFVGNNNTQAVGFNQRKTLILIGGPWDGLKLKVLFSWSLLWVCVLYRIHQADGLNFTIITDYIVFLVGSCEKLEGSVWKI